MTNTIYKLFTFYSLLGLLLIALPANADVPVYSEIIKENFPWFGYFVIAIFLINVVAVSLTILSAIRRNNKTSQSNTKAAQNNKQ